MEQTDILIKKQTFITKNEGKLEEVYKLGKKKLGSGAFGVVTKCRHRTSKQNRACKTIAKKKVKNMAQFNAEINILQLLDNPYILKLYEFFEDDTNFYVITELCTGGEMFDRIIEKEFYTEAEAAHAFKQFMQGINYCHNRGVVHRDLKPENFLYESKEPDSDIKIIDFGLSKIFRPGQGGVNKMTTRAGTVSIFILMCSFILFYLAILHFTRGSSWKL